jgi:hypothetical protein
MTTLPIDTFFNDINNIVKSIWYKFTKLFARFNQYINKQYISLSIAKISINEWFTSQLFFDIM